MNDDKMRRIVSIFSVTAIIASLLVGIWLSFGIVSTGVALGYASTTIATQLFQPWVSILLLDMCFLALHPTFSSFQARQMERVREDIKQLRESQ